MTNERAVEILNLDLDILGQYGGETAEAYKMAIQALEAQPSEDCISREEAINEADNLSLETSYDNEKVEQMLRDLPSVTPERPKGKWIETLEHRDEFGSTWHYECSECRAKSYKGFEPLERYCPNCGAEMSGGGEDEVSN